MDVRQRLSQSLPYSMFSLRKCHRRGYRCHHRREVHCHRWKLASPQVKVALHQVLLSTSYMNMLSFFCYNKTTATREKKQIQCMLASRDNYSPTSISRVAVLGLSEPQQCTCSAPYMAKGQGDMHSHWGTS